MQHNFSAFWRSVKLCGLLLIFALSAHAAERAIDKEIVVPAGLDAAWAAWTSREGIISFFAPDAVVDAKVGGAFHIYINPLAEPGMKGADDMRFLAVQPKQMITFDWNAPPNLPEARAQRTFVMVRFFVIDDKNTVKQMDVSVAGKVGDLIQVSTVKPGDKVVLNPSDKVKDGANVAIVKK